MPPELIGILTQMPIVAAFIWYSWALNKFYSAEREKKDAAYATEIKELREVVTGFRAEFKTAVELMKERTRPTTRTRTKN